MTLATDIHFAEIGTERAAFRRKIIASYIAHHERVIIGKEVYVIMVVPCVESLQYAWLQMAEESPPGASHLSKGDRMATQTGEGRQKFIGRQFSTLHLAKYGLPIAACLEVGFRIAQS